MRSVTPLARMLATAGVIAAFVGVLTAATPDNVAKLRSTGSCAGCDLFGENLSGLQAPNADLTNANLGEAMFYAANLSGANFSGAITDGANFNMANLKGAVGIDFAKATSDQRTVCPDGQAGPCR